MGRKAKESEAIVEAKVKAFSRWIDYKEAQIRYGFGETKIREMAKECGALYKVKGSTRIDMEIMDAYMKTFVDET